MKELWQRHKKALIFIMVFMAIYLSLNTVYGLYINVYYPQADPFTLIVAEHTIAFLDLFYDKIDLMFPEASKMIPVFVNDQAVLDIYEGCNSLNVMIVYLAFIVAFRGSLKSTLIFAVLGFVLIYLMNIGRLSLLIESTQSFPDYFFFFHKYAFTASIYSVVFVLWYFWTRQVTSYS